jgi:hypothetical protein
LVLGDEVRGLAEGESFGSERADVVLFDVGQPGRQEPRATRPIVAFAAPPRSDALGEEPTGSIPSCRHVAVELVIVITLAGRNAAR